MKKGILIFVAFFLPLLPAQYISVSGGGQPAYSGGGGVTFTTVQHTGFSNCSSYTGTCPVTVTSTTSGNLGLMCGGLNSGSGSETTSVPTGGGTWTHAPNTFAEGNGSQSYYSDCYYNTNLSGGATTITWNSSHTATNWAMAAFVEVHRSSGSWTYDTSNGNFDAACTACASPSLTISGTDYVYYWAGPNDQAYVSTSGITADFNDNQSFVVGPSLGMNVSTAENGVSTYHVATFNTGASDTLPVSVVAFK